MNEFLLVFRRDFKTEDVQPSPEELQTHLQHWKEWYTTLAEKDILARNPQRWDGQGRVVKQDKNAINGPYAEIKESIGGVIIIKAESYDDAVAIAKGSPIFELGGTVEIRMGL